MTRPSIGLRVRRVQRELTLLVAAWAALVGPTVAAEPDATRLSSATATFDDHIYPADVDIEPNQDSDIDTATVEPAQEGFLDASTLRLKPRSYYLDREYDRRQTIEGWALGGALEYGSGWWHDRARLDATVHTSQKLYAPRGKDGTMLFKPGPEQITVLSEAYATVRIDGELGMRIGRQSFELPYLGSHDIRMVPNTFEAISIGSREAGALGYLFGYVDAIKLKNEDDFIPMAEAAGVSSSNEGVLFGGAQYTFEDGTLLGAVNQNTPDLFNTFFAKAERSFSLGDTSSLGVFLQGTDQRSVGSELIGTFDTSLLAAKLEATFGNALLRVGASTVDSERGIQKPYGNPANYLSIIVNDFDRAGEDAWMIGGNYNFGRVGPGNLTGFVNVVDGNTPDNGTQASSDQTEYNATLDYRVRESWAENVWLRVRVAYIDQDESVAGGDDFVDVRLIVNYTYDVR